MNKTWKSIFSVLLAVALLLPMAPVVRAEDTVSGKAVRVVGNQYDRSEDVDAIELTTDAANNTIYYRGDKDNGTIVVKATITTKPSTAAYDGPIAWKLDEGAPLSPAPIQGTASAGQATVTMKATDPGTSGKTVNLTASAGGHSHTIQITVKQDIITGVAFSTTEESIQVNKTVQLSFNKTLSYPSGVSTAPKVEYDSNNKNVATVSASGLVTGVKEGEAEIRAYVDGNEVGNRVKVYVNSASTSFLGNATLRNQYSMESIYNEFRDEFIKTFRSNPTLVSFPDLRKGNGTLRAKDGTEIISGGSYKPSDFQTMYLEPTNEGDFKCTAVMTDGTNKLSAAITVAISAPTATILIPIDGSANYSFATVSADPSGKTGLQLVKEGIGVFGSLVFGTISSESSNVGALYTATPVSNENRVSNGTVVPATSINELYFTPSRPGTYKAPFTAYAGSSGYGAVVCTGELLLSVDGSSLDITVNLDSVAPFTFSDKLKASSDSLYSQLLSAINSSIGNNSWGGIRFDGAANASSTGTLHESSSHSLAISASDYIAKSAMSKLYYVPARSGTYEITYGVYPNEGSDRVIVTGKLTIKTSTIPAGMSDITYTTTVKDSVTLYESDFIDFFQTANGSKYQLSYVVFNEYDGDGTFYHGTNSFLPYSSADFYTTTYTGSVPTNARYLDRLSFTAPSDAGYTAVLFTCYGGTGTDSVNRVTSGKLCIYYTADNVPVVSYDAYNLASLGLKESDFATVYNTAMKTTISKPTFNIQFLNTPGKGTLYYYYSTSGRRALSSSNVANYTFSVNDTSGVSIAEVSYEPARGTTGTDEVTYLVTSSNGTILYIGTIQFKLSTDLSLNVTNDGGSNFDLKNFYSASDSDPVLYVTFSQPSSGKVYVYASGRYVAVSANTKLYTISPADGQYPLTSAFYAPKANEAGTVSLKYTAHRKSGVTNNSTMTINVLSKLSSGTFGDVNGVFSWAANSIDFASKMGLVNGTQLNPPLFSPANTMRRSDFVLMLYRLAGSPAVSGTVPYTDVPAGKYYYNSAVWAYQNNIMRNVTANGLYNPEGALTRQDFAQILFNYTVSVGGNTTNNGSILSYSDASSVSANTIEGVTWAVANGYITSAVTGALYIEPTRSATRAEISTLLHRYLTY